MLDPRIWYPDESCNPFYFTYFFEPLGGYLVFSFVVPPGQIAVIKHLSAETQLAFGIPTAAKETQRFILMRYELLNQNDPFPLAPAGALHCVNLHGSLGNVRELTALGSARDGLICFPYDLDETGRDCCIICDAGPWSFVADGSLWDASVTVQASLSGYTFPQERSEA